MKVIFVIITFVSVPRVSLPRICYDYHTRHRLTFYCQSDSLDGFIIFFVGLYKFSPYIVCYLIIKGNVVYVNLNTALLLF